MHAFGTLDHVGGGQSQEGPVGALNLQNTHVIVFADEQDVRDVRFAGEEDPQGGFGFPGIQVPFDVAN
jgi:hypothetical protein